MQQSRILHLSDVILTDLFLDFQQNARVPLIKRRNRVVLFDCFGKAVFVVSFELFEDVLEQFALATVGKCGKHFFVLLHRDLFVNNRKVNEVELQLKSE